MAHHLYPRHFVSKPYATLGWPMRPGDWLPEIDPAEPAFENYYQQNYQTAERGIFVNLDPLGDLEEKAARVRHAFQRASNAEIEGAARMPQSRSPCSSRAMR